jgi:hypothetical protein
MLYLIDMLLDVFFAAVVYLLELRSAELRVADEDLVIVLDEVFVDVPFEEFEESLVVAIEEYHVSRDRVVFEVEESILANGQGVHLVEVGHASIDPCVTHEGLSQLC